MLGTVDLLAVLVKEETSCPSAHFLVYLTRPVSRHCPFPEPPLLLFVRSGYTGPLLWDPNLKGKPGFGARSEGSEGPGPTSSVSCSPGRLTLHSCNIPVTGMANRRSSTMVGLRLINPS